MNFAQPIHIDEALSLLKESKWSILAGGTDFYPSLAGGTPSGNVMDISRLKSLSEITQCEDYWHIGALVTWSDIISAPLPPAFDALKLAAREVGSVQIQNRATIIGNICNASPAADGIPPLLCLDAIIRVSSNNGQRDIPLQDFITGNRQISLADDELVTDLLIPKSSTGGISGFIKLGARKYLVISISMVAVRLAVDNNKQILSAAISVGSCSVVALRLNAFESSLIGKIADDKLPGLIQPHHFDALSPIDDIRASADYRKHSAEELVRRCLAEVASRS